MKSKLGKPQQLVAKDLMERVKERGYLYPQIVTTQYQTLRAVCVACKADMHLNGYIRHFVVRHTLDGLYERHRAIETPTKRRGRPKHSATSWQLTTNEQEWRQKAKLSHQNIIAKYGSKPKEMVN